MAVGNAIPATNNDQLCTTFCLRTFHWMSLIVHYYDQLTTVLASEQLTCRRTMIDSVKSYYKLLLHSDAFKKIKQNHLFPITFYVQILVIRRY